MTNSLKIVLAVAVATAFVFSGNFVFAESVPYMESLAPPTVEMGEIVTIEGENFGQGIYIEFLDKSLTLSPLSYTDNSLTFRVSSAIGLGQHTIQLGMKASDVKSNRAIFMVVAPPEPQPAISSISPATAKVGDIVTIYGSNLGQGSYVEVVGESMTSPAVSYANNSLTFRVSSAYSVGRHTIRIGKKASDVRSNSLALNVVASTPVESNINQDIDANSGEDRVEQELDALDAAQKRITQEQQNRIRRLADLMVVRLSAALDRIDGFIARLESRLDKMDALGLDTEEARDDLKDVQFLVEDGRSDVGQISAQVERILESASPQSAFDNLQGLVTRIIETNIKTAHSDLATIIRNLREIIENR
jgi:hypothetical protein